MSNGGKEGAMRGAKLLQECRTDVIVLMHDVVLSNVSSKTMGAEKRKLIIFKAGSESALKILGP